MRPGTIDPQAAERLLGLASECLAPVKTLAWGWDGRRARPVTPSAARSAAVILAGLWSAAASHPEGTYSGDFVLKPQMFPLPDGGVQLEWHAGSAELEVAAMPDGSMVITAVDPEQGIDVTVELDPRWPGRPVDPAVHLLAVITQRVWEARPPLH
jgi:hypothetical protein